MAIKIKKEKLVKYLVDSLDLSDIKNATSGLKEFDFNPFDDDGDEYETAWDEIVHNKDLLVEFCMALVRTADRLIVEGQKLTSAQKHDAVVSALDDAIALPWYAEPFDSKLISLLVTSLVKTLNAVKPQRAEPAVVVARPSKYKAGSLNPAYFEPPKPTSDPASDSEDTPINIKLTPTGIFKEIG